MSTEAADPERHLQRRFLGSLLVFPAQREALEGGIPVFSRHHVLPARLENSRDAEEAEVCDHHLPVVVENIF